MRKLILVASFFPMVLVVSGCPMLKKQGADAESDAAVVDATAVVEDAAPAPAADAAVAPAPAPAAKNAASVARFPGETPIPNEATKVAAASASVRTTPKAGSVVATLAKGTEVNKIAEYQDCELVTFADPKDASSVLMGWVTKDAFTATAPATATDAGTTAVDGGAKDAGGIADAGAAADAGKPATAAKCVAGQELVMGFGKDAICKKKCASDKDCKNAAAGSCAVAATTTGKVARVCTNE